MTEYKMNQIIDALKGIERQLKAINKNLSKMGALQDARPQPAEDDPMGYTE